jgi:asparagine synthase (glutamine-hydrolysing)
MFSPDFLAQIDFEATSQIYESLFRHWPSESPADKAMGLDLQTHLPGDLLRMGDRVSMAHSLELRVPFCDHELLAFALQMPDQIRFPRRKLKGFMRNALKSVLPAETVTTPKRSFTVPIARWLRENLHDMVHDLLSEDRVRRRGYLNPDYVKWLISEHESGRRSFADQIYSLLVLELWQQNLQSETIDVII